MEILEESGTQEATSTWKLPLPVLPMPKTRSECIDAPRPCTFAQCRYNLMFEAEPEQFVEFSCALDAADDGEHSLATLAEIFGLSRERVRQIEQRALRKLGETDVLRKVRQELSPRKRKRRPYTRRSDELDLDLDF